MPSQVQIAKKQLATKVLQAVREFETQFNNRIEVLALDIPVLKHESIEIGNAIKTKPEVCCDRNVWCSAAININNCWSPLLTEDFPE
jgi:hypothetical protein